MRIRPRLAVAHRTRPTRALVFLVKPRLVLVFLAKPHLTLTFLTKLHLSVAHLIRPIALILVDVLLQMARGPVVRQWTPTWRTSHRSTTRRRPAT